MSKPKQIRNNPLATSSAHLKIPIATSLAELLVSFRSKQYISVCEACSLCYKLLDHLKVHFADASHVYHKKLCYPTLANISINEKGQTFIESTSTPVGQTTSYIDWLVVLSQTLRSHTAEHGSSTTKEFNRLLSKLEDESLWKQSSLHHLNNLQRICLELILIRSSKQKDCNSILGNLYKRSKRVTQMTMMVERNHEQLDETKYPYHQQIPNRAFLKTNSTSNSIGADQEYTEEEFTEWTKKWGMVNDEFVRKKTLSSGSLENTKEVGPIKSAFPVDDDDEAEEIEEESCINMEHQNITTGKHSYFQSLLPPYASFINKPLDILQRKLRLVRNTVFYRNRVQVNTL